MAGRMTILAVRRTGSVLGATTTVAAGTAATVETMAGPEFPVRLTSGRVRLPAGDLTVAEVAFDQRILDEPERGRLVLPGGSDQSASLAFVDASRTGVLSSITASTFTVGLSPAPAAPLETAMPFCVVLQADGGPAFVVTGQIKAGAVGSDPVPHGLAGGVTYAALVLVEGVARREQSVPVP